jgi:hypothetical protein
VKAAKNMGESGPGEKQGLGGINGHNLGLDSQLLAEIMHPESYAVGVPSPAHEVDQGFFVNHRVVICLNLPLQQQSLVCCRM